MNRLSFLRRLSLGAAVLAFSNVFQACVNQAARLFSFKRTDGNAKAGHLVREPLPDNTPISRTEHCDVLIIGGGISGLAAGYFLTKKGAKNIKLIELDAEIGGNAKNGENKYSKYPYGAHYLPIPNATNTDLIQFLYENKIITGFNAENIPIYNEFDLCHDPKERLLTHKYWQEGLIPIPKMPEDKADFDRFFHLINELKNLKDDADNFVFELPLAKSKLTARCREWDTYSFAHFLQKETLNSPSLLWYLNYCCRDDYGQTIDQISAFAGLFYFAVRRGKGANCEENAVLTWPEGNAHLVELLAKDYKNAIFTQQVVRKINADDTNTITTVFDIKSNTHYQIIAKKIILSVPFAVRKKIFPIEINTPLILEHQPWLVATLTLRYFDTTFDKNGYPLSWDNVFMEGETLGLVFAQHQNLQTPVENFVFTLYKPLGNASTKTPAEIRQLYYQKTDLDLQHEIISDLTAIYPTIKQELIAIDCKILGHGMVSPSINFLLNRHKKNLSLPYKNKVFFAHTDYSGISLFEEAFWQGLEAANAILHDNL
ncbi:MAG: hypothetical protein RI894_1395 [Bacteroidota bacterium]|jgi:hypothetical protein